MASISLLFNGHFTGHFSANMKSVTAKSRRHGNRLTRVIIKQIARIARTKDSNTFHPSIQSLWLLINSIQLINCTTLRESLPAATPRHLTSTHTRHMCMHFGVKIILVDNAAADWEYPDSVNLFDKRGTEMGQERFCLASCNWLRFPSVGEGELSAPLRISLYIEH